MPLVEHYSKITNDLPPKGSPKGYLFCETKFPPNMNYSEKRMKGNLKAPRNMCIR